MHFSAPVNFLTVGFIVCRWATINCQLTVETSHCASATVDDSDNDKLHKLLMEMKELRSGLSALHTVKAEHDKITKTLIEVQTLQREIVLNLTEMKYRTDNLSETITIGYDELHREKQECEETRKMLDSKIDTMNHTVIYSMQQLKPEIIDNFSVLMNHIDDIATTINKTMIRLDEQSSKIQQNNRHIKNIWRTTTRKLATG